MASWYEKLSLAAMTGTEVELSGAEAKELYAEIGRAWKTVKGIGMWACGEHDPKEVGVVCGACHKEEVEQLRRGVVRPVEGSEVPATLVLRDPPKAALFRFSKKAPRAQLSVYEYTPRYRAAVGGTAKWSVVIGENGPVVAFCETEEDANRTRDLLLALAELVRP